MDIQLDQLRSQNQSKNQSFIQALIPELLIEQASKTNQFIDYSGNLINDVAHNYKLLSTKQHWIYYKGTFNIKIVDTVKNVVIHLTVITGEIDTPFSTYEAHKLIAWIGQASQIKYSANLAGQEYVFTLKNLSKIAMEQYFNNLHIPKGSTTIVKIDRDTLLGMIEAIKAESNK